MDVRLIELGEKIHDALKTAHTQGVGQYTKRLAGACAVGSFLFMEEAKRRFNIDLQFIATSGHAWTEFQNEIYDVTATQFDRKEKVFHSHRNALDNIQDDDHCVWYYKKASRISLKEINTTWPDYQRPNNYKLIWLFDTKPIIIYKDSLK